MSSDFVPLTIQEYASKALSTDQRSDSGSLTFPLLGLFGETGSLLSEVKKKQRDQASYLGYAAAVVEELGDVLWYLNTVASRGGLSVSDVFANVQRGFADWQKTASADLQFASLQPAIMNKQSQPTEAFERTLLRLAGEVGLLVTDQEAGRLENNQATLAGRLVAIARTLIQASNEAGVTLEAAAVKNLAKIFDRWPRDPQYPEWLDLPSPPEEQLPRKLTIDIFERVVRGQTFVFQRCNGIYIGDRLTDNAVTPDDYRFHDVFHYAHAAILGWSPVVRALFHLKRKSDPKLDEVEDGARATLIEEGVTTWVFGQAINLELFAKNQTRRATI